MMRIEKDFGFGNDKCVKCSEEKFESKTLSRCLRCGKATSREINGKEYFKNKYKIGDELDGI